MLKNLGFDRIGLATCQLGLLAGGLALLLVNAAAIAADPASLSLQPNAQGTSLTITRGEATTIVHQTTNSIADLRLIELADSPASVALWSETGIAGRTAWYSMSMDGVNYSEPRATTYDIKLRFAQFDPLLDTPQVPEPLAIGAGEQHNGMAQRNNKIGQQPTATTALYIVQYVAPPIPALVSPVQNLGGVTRAYLAEHAQVVEMTPAVRDQVAALPIVRWVGPFHPAYRVEELLVDELSAPSSNIPTRRYSIMLFERGAAAQQELVNRITALGGVINTTNPDGFRIEATLTAQQLRQVIQWNSVQFVDRWTPSGTDMDIARQIGGAVPLLTGLGFTGQGVRGEVMDGGIRQTHQAYLNPAPLIHGQNPAVSSHGTNTYGIVFGNGAANAAGTGMLPNREQGIFATYNQLSSQGGTVSRYTHTAELVDPNGSYRAVFQSNSWGGGLTTQYTTRSAEFDDILFINDILVCQSQSNQNTQSSRPEAWSKNTVSIGGVNHFNSLQRTDDSSSLASIGPAADGRIKPDLAHFYESVLCTTSSSDTAYTTSFGGTSAATPITCGHFGLLFQMWHEGVFSGFGGASTVFDSRPHMSTAKAMMINAAYRYNWLAGGSNAGLTRIRQGWGMADVGRLYNERNLMFIVNESDPLEPLESKVYTLNVAAGTPEFRATLVYTDPAGSPTASVHRINDLSMKVTAPSGTFYWGNNGLTAGNYSIAGGSPNTIDTVENVFVQNPQAGTWTVTIYADVLVQDARVETPQIDVDYALVVAGGTPLPLCPADITGDLQVNVNDLLAVINAWGACPNPPAACPADIFPQGGDGLVNVNDLLAVINAWGGCQ